MVSNMKVFASPKIEAEFTAAYDAALHEWPIRYDEVYIPTSFGETHVIISGPKDAIPVVLLNPGGGSVAIWRYNVEPLSQHFRTFAVDVIGEMNKSIPTRPITNYIDFTHWIVELFKGLNIKDAHIIGNSNGGFFSLNIALHLPELVQKVVLVSPAATFIQYWPMWWHVLVPAHMIAPIIHSERLVHRAYAWLWQDFPKDESYAKLNSISKIAGYPRYRPTRNSFAPRVFTDEELRQIHKPILLLIGDHEVIYDPRRAIKRAIRLVTGLKAEIIPNANHCAQYTAPEIVNQKILEFLLNSSVEYP
jgi:pimeloyl-ACP methyl ester carboxylesterase